MSLLIRAARPEDALDVARVHVRAWQVGYRGLLPDEYLNSLRPEERAARYAFADPNADRPFTIVAVAQGSIAGFATTLQSSDVPHYGEVGALYVDPDRWRQGVGQALIARAREHLAQRFEQAALWVLEGNSLASCFYLRDGWICDDVWREEIRSGARMRSVRWSRRLR